MLLDGILRWVPYSPINWCQNGRRRNAEMSQRREVVLCSVVTVIEIGTETAVFRQNRTETEVLCLSVGGFENGAALVS